MIYETMNGRASFAPRVRAINGVSDFALTLKFARYDCRSVVSRGHGFAR